MDQSKHTREGPVERVILEIIEQRRKRLGRRGRHYDTDRHISEYWIGRALERQLERGKPGYRSGRTATRAAMRRFVAKHPRFAVEWQSESLVLYEIKSPEVPVE
jgi:hypothetical protein